MDSTGNVLEFTEVACEALSPHDVALREVTFRLGPGEIALILAEGCGESLPLADLAQGLVEPAAGTVCFCGESWKEMGSRRAARQRGGIRRVFESEGWVHNLDVMDNLILSELHHTDRSRKELEVEAEQVARDIGVAELPAGRPARVAGALLRKLEWVRALMGHPVLIVIERRQLGVSREDMNRFVTAIGAAVARGTAVLWITAESYLWGHAGLACAARYRMGDGKLEHAYEV